MTNTLAGGGADTLRIPPRLAGPPEPPLPVLVELPPPHDSILEADELERYCSPPFGLSPPTDSELLRRRLQHAVDKPLPVH